MSKLDVTDFPSLSAKSAARLAGAAQRKAAVQATAASATLFVWTAEWSGYIADTGCNLGAAPASGETISVDIKKNGTSIMKLGTPKTIDSTTGKKTISLFESIDKNAASFQEGDVITATLAYTAGGAPTPVANTQVWIEPSFAHWKA